MKTPEDEAFDDLARRQGAWGGGFNAKRQAAMDKVNAEFSEEYIKYRTAFPKGYIAPQQEPVKHWSDCAVHNGPAYPAGPCDCGIEKEPVCDKDPQGCWNVRCQLGKQCKNLAQPAQEPPKYAISAYWEEDGRIGVVATVVRPDGGVHLLNAIIDPPKHKWVGLTDEDISSVIMKLQEMYHRPPIEIFARAIEAKLKEKNA